MELPWRFAMWLVAARTGDLVGIWGSFRCCDLGVRAEAL